MQRKISNKIRRFPAYDCILLVGLVILGFGTWGFVAIADGVVRGKVQKFDEWGLRCLRSPDDVGVLIGPSWVEQVARDVTTLGNVSVLACINLGVAGGFIARRKFKALAFVLTAVVGGLLVWLLLKVIVARPRPQLVPYLCTVDGSSFPSGHAMMSAIVYLTLGVLLASSIARWQFKLILLVLAILLASVIGISRVCMGVHYPTDVLAGWMAGLVWATFCWLLARKPLFRVSDTSSGVNPQTRRD